MVARHRRTGLLRWCTTAAVSVDTEVSPPARTSRSCSAAHPVAHFGRRRRGTESNAGTCWSIRGRARRAAARAIDVRLGPSSGAIWPARRRHSGGGTGGHSEERPSSAIPPSLVYPAGWSRPAISTRFPPRFAWLLLRNNRSLLLDRSQARLAPHKVRGRAGLHRRRPSARTGWTTVRRFALDNSVTLYYLLFSPWADSCQAC